MAPPPPRPEEPPRALEAPSEASNLPPSPPAAAAESFSLYYFCSSFSSSSSVPLPRGLNSSLLRDSNREHYESWPEGPDFDPFSTFYPKLTISQRICS